jgi:hypothetical protein
MRISKRLTTTLVAISAAALFGAACGDDDGGSPDANTNPDAPSAIDANTTPDAAGPRHTGTVAVSEVTVTTPGAPGLRGAAVSAIYDDPGNPSGEVLFGVSPPISTCLVKKYTPSDTENPPLNEGPITIAGNGVLKPLGTCEFAEGLGYECTIDSGSAGITVTRANPNAPVYNVAIAGEAYADTDLVGSYVRLSGFATGKAGTYNGTFPVIRQTNLTKPATVTVLTVVISQAVSGATETVAAADYRLLGGFGPVPTAGFGFEIDADFLGPATSSVTITKADTAAPGAPALNVNLPPAGEGFAVDGEGDAILPHEFPFTAGPVTLTCGESCGAEPTGATAGLQVIAISGRTTDVPLPAPSAEFPPFFMPPTSATVAAYATFQCTFFKSPTAGTFTATMPQEAVAAILSTNPTRIETRVFRFSVSQTGANTLVGHGAVGHSSRPVTAN